MLNITKELISINYSQGRTITPQYIVIHETDNESYGATARANRNYFANHSEAQASTHFVVDDSNIIQCAELNWRCWHVGDNNGYSDITNSNSIGIEICVNADGNYEQAKSNAIDLVKYLMSELGLGIDRVKMHNDASGKYCPRRILDNGLWNDFLARVSGVDYSPTISTQSQSTQSDSLSPIQKAKQFVGSRILELQQKINIAFGYDIAEDSDFGNQTYTALGEAQIKLGITCDYMAGNQTFSALDNYIDSKTVKATPTPQSPTSNNVLLIQQLCNFYGARIEEDSIWGSQTESAIRQYLPTAGIPYTCPRATLIIQQILGISADGIYMGQTEASVKEFQANQGNLEIDGIVGFSTYCALAKS